jgi:hypothetical protein
LTKPSTTATAIHPPRSPRCAIPEHAFRPASSTEIRDVWQERWGGGLVVSLSHVYRPEDVSGAFVLDANGSAAALVTWSVEESEIVSLDAWGAGRPGAAALRYAEDRLRDAGASVVRLCTTNDNLRAIQLYVRAGYRVVRVHLDEMDRVRALKPTVPLTGYHGLPLRDVWELEKRLD